MFKVKSTSYDGVLQMQKVRSPLQRAQSCQAFFDYEDVWLIKAQALTLDFSYRPFWWDLYNCVL